jgi:hypothetical protein
MMSPETERRHYRRVTDILIGCWVVQLIVTGVFVLLTLNSLHDSSTAASDASAAATQASRNAIRLEAEAWNRCNSGQQILGLFNENFAVPLRLFLRDAAHARRVAANDPATPESVRRVNRRTADAYDRYRARATDFVVPACGPKPG